MLSEEDLAIISALRVDARSSFREIAKTVNQPESTVRHRLMRLIDNKLISINVLPNPQALGYEVWVCIGLHIDMKYCQSVADALSSFNEVYFVAFSAGGYDILLNAVFRSNDHLLTFLTKHLPTIDGIKAVSTHIFLNVVKRDLSILPPSGDQIPQ